MFDNIARKNNQLPEAERNQLEHGLTYIGFNAAFCTLIVNSLFQCISYLTYADLTDGLPIAMIPFLTANVSYNGFISSPLSADNFNLIVNAVP
jgi:transmembrane protein 126A